MRLTFLSGPPKNIPTVLRVPSELLALAGQELLEVRVTGSIRKPQIDTVPLRSIDRIFQEMLNPQ
jgi:hypothetical protein